MYFREKTLLLDFAETVTCQFAFQQNLIYGYENRTLESCLFRENFSLISISSLMIASDVSLCPGISFLPPESLIFIARLCLYIWLYVAGQKKWCRYKIIFMYFVKISFFCINIIICLADFYHHSSEEFCTLQNGVCIRTFVLNYELLSSQKICLDTLENSHGGTIFSQFQSC